MKDNESDYLKLNLKFEEKKEEVPQLRKEIEKKYLEIEKQLTQSSAQNQQLILEMSKKSEELSSGKRVHLQNTQTTDILKKEYNELLLQNSQLIEFPKKYNSLLAKFKNLQSQLDSANVEKSEFGAKNQQSESKAIELLLT